MDRSKAQPVIMGLDLSSGRDMVAIQLPPRLVIRLLEDANSPGGKVIALCTEDGKAFGMQTACTVTSETECFTTVTATFIVDGKAIRFE